MSSRASTSAFSTSSASASPASPASGEDRQQLLALAHRARALRGHEVAEQLAHERRPLRADPLERRLRVLREGAGDAADLAVRLARQQPLLAVALLPEPRGGEGEERQRAALLLHLRHHLVDERLVLEAVAAGERRLHERAPQRALARAARAA